MDMSVIRTFFYVSRSLAAPDDLERILSSARRRNASRDVTGALLFTGGYFAQVLEGAEDALADTVSAIQADTRHADMRCLLAGEIASRRFAGWSMAFMEAPGADELIQQLLAQTGSIEAERAQRLLRLMFDPLVGEPG